jgi:hypothetical protein
MTIVPVGTLDKNPRNLPYHFKSMSVISYAKLSASFYFWRLVQTLEKAAQQNGRILVPSECFHWRRKEQLRDFHITIFKKGFYQVLPSELSEIENKKYLRLAAKEYEADPEEIHNMI